MRKMHVRHNMSHTSIYNVWREMRQRCNNPNNRYYYMYGGKGVKVCELWANDFLAFNEWANSNGYKEGLTIDRIDGDKDYEPGNCRWVDMKVQSNNTKRNVLITINGVTKTMMQWSELLNMPYCTLKVRYNKGLRGEELIYRGSYRNLKRAEA